MCIAIYKNYENYVGEQTLKRCFDGNPHGAGFALYNDEMGLVVEKGLMTFQEFMAAYEPFNGKDKKRLTKGAIHFRIATNGGVTKENTHPFVIERPDGYRLAIVHNGIIAKLSYDKDISDTKLFVETILTPLIANDKYAWMNDGFIKVAQEYIGWSKMVLIDSEGNSIIYNERSGHWVENVWFSNYSYDDYFGWGNEYDYQNYMLGSDASSLTENKRWIREADGSLWKPDMDLPVVTDYSNDRVVDLADAITASLVEASEMNEIPLPSIPPKNELTSQADGVA